MTLAEFILAFRERAPETRGACFYCGQQTDKNCKETHAHRYNSDHVIPRSAKGHKMAHNRVTCCRHCNDIKEDLTLPEFKRRSKIQVFFAETFLGITLEELTDFEQVTYYVETHRRIEGRCIKFNGRVERRTVPVEFYGS